MRAAILIKPGEFRIEDRPIPKFGDNEVLVKTTICGICTGEIDMWEGKSTGFEFPIFIGHEVGGFVESTGKDVKNLRPGDPVAVWAYGKGFAEYVAVNEEYAVKLAQDTRIDHALGEPIACSVNGIRKADVQFNDSVCIVGCGFMGLIMLQIFRARGAGLLIAVDRRESILRVARLVGADFTFNPQTDDVKKRILELTNGNGVDIGVEAGGNQATLDLTGELVRMEGKLEVFGFHQGGMRSVNWAHWNWMAFQIVNGHSRSAHLYAEGMRIGIGLLEGKRLNMEPLVTHWFPLKDINKGFKVASAKEEGYIKGVITI